MPRLPKLSRLEKALLANLGLEVIAPGTTRAALLATARGLGTISPPVARGALGVGRAALGAGAGLARRHPAAAAIGTVYVLNELGYLEPVTEQLRQFPQTFAEDLPRFEGPLVQEAIKPATRVKNKFSKAVGKGMRALKASSSYGKKGVISNAKAAFKTATKAASARARGKKMPKSGPSKIAYKAAKTVYTDEILRRKMK